MQNYVISLKNQIKRREHIQKQFSQQGIPFEFFDAVTPDKVEELADRFKIKLNNPEITLPEYGCLLSHVCLWQKIVDDNLPYMGIFEDDIYLGEGADSLLKDGSWLPEDFDIIRLEKYHDKVNTSLFSSYSYQNFYFYQLLKYEWGTAGYIISNKSAKSFLDYIKHIKIIGHADYILFSILLPLQVSYIIENKSIPKKKMKIWQMNPAICIQDEQLNPDNTTLVSDLQTLRSEQQVKVKQARKLALPLRKKIIRELIRPFKQLVNKIRQVCYLSYYRTIELTPLHKKD